jgi:PTS system mannose-specific IIA component
MNSIFIIAHAPLAQALRQCALHVFPDCERHIAALDVLPNVSPEETLAAARITLEMALRTPRSHALVLVDVFGATPCNVAQKLVDGRSFANLSPASTCPCCCAPCLTVNESLDALVAACHGRALRRV